MKEIQISNMISIELAQRSNKSVILQRQVVLQEMNSGKPTVCEESFLRFVDCVIDSKCVTEDRKPIRECIQDKETIEGCSSERFVYFACRKSMVTLILRIHHSDHE
jgi:hypothetical protein